MNINKEAMAQGYQEMAEINLGISQECFYAESETDGVILSISANE